MAEEHNLMTMQKWIDVTDKLLVFSDKKIFDNFGMISHKKVIKKASDEYDKFRIKQDREYVSSIDEMYRRYLDESENK